MLNVCLLNHLNVITHYVNFFCLSDHLKDLQVMNLQCT